MRRPPRWRRRRGGEDRATRRQPSRHSRGKTTENQNRRPAATLADSARPATALAVAYAHKPSLEQAVGRTWRDSAPGTAEITGRAPVHVMAAHHHAMRACVRRHRGLGEARQGEREERRRENGEGCELHWNGTWTHARASVRCPGPPAAFVVCCCTSSGFSFRGGDAQLRPTDKLIPPKTYVLSVLSSPQTRPTSVRTRSAPMVTLARISSRTAISVPSHEGCAVA